MKIEPQVDKEKLKTILSTYDENPDKCYQALILFAEITALAYGKEVIRSYDNSYLPSES